MPGNIQGLPRDRVLTSGPNLAGLSYRGTSTLFFVRDPATAGLKYFVCTGSGNHGTERFFLYEIRPPRYSPGRDVATTGLKGI